MHPALSGNCSTFHVPVRRGLAQAQRYPAKTIRMIIASRPRRRRHHGALNRAELSHCGAIVVAENRRRWRALAAELVAKAPPDGLQDIKASRDPITPASLKLGTIRRKTFAGTLAASRRGWSLILRPG